MRINLVVSVDFRRERHQVEPRTYCVSITSIEVSFIAVTLLGRPNKENILSKYKLASAIENNSFCFSIIICEEDLFFFRKKYSLGWDFVRKRATSWSPKSFKI